MQDASDDNQLRDFRVRLLAIDADVKSLRLYLKAGFDPNQPRVPAGDPEGGQWADGGGMPAAAGGMAQSGNRRKPRALNSARPALGGRTFSRRLAQGDDRSEALALGQNLGGSGNSRTVVRHEGAIIVSESRSLGTVGADERHTVTTNAGAQFTFETNNGRQQIFDAKGTLLGQTLWTSAGPQAEPLVQSAAVTSGQARQLMEAGRALYNWLSRSTSPELRACLAFTAREFGKAKAGLEITFVGMVPRERVEAVCERLGDVQKLTDAAAREAGNKRSYSSPAVYGTAVHTGLRKKILALNDPTLRSELSLAKRFEETGTRLGSVRIDVIEDRGTGAICVYDIKTGAAGLSQKRSMEFANRLLKRLAVFRPIIVTEVRPSQ